MSVTVIDRGWNRIKRDMEKLNNQEIAVGLFDREEARKGIINEFGTKDGRIPKRPFMRNSFDKNEQKELKLANELIWQMMEKKINKERMLGLVGESMVSNAKEIILRGMNFVENAPSTIAAKGSSRPLVDTGAMVDSITYKNRKYKRERIVE